ncbi:MULTISPECIES: helix-turn-helix domain-containing protein [unclassified Nonomuraea]|uniref:helix-turn-helix domain-containing protein n=1 Tax=unclassified Nonomuraea TaxID=2593643 RepID=UPI001378F465|nr:helix-turn-helix domain-containing protein [Nonomuraea sp. KC401]NBE99057.1 helix-turn-helix domain-containing protein [Nonomuraea sp. K271]
MTETIGVRVAGLRKLRGYSQRGLATRAHVSYSLLTKVESGHAPASPAFIGAVARALKVDVPRITGQPYQEPVSQGQRLQAVVEPLRRALLTQDLPPEEAPEPRSLAELRKDVEEASQLGRQARYLRLGEMLPSLLEELSIAVHHSDDPRLHALMAEAYGGVSALAHMLGYQDMRGIVLERIEREAQLSRDPLRVARTRWSRGVSLLAVAAYEQGLRLMEQTRRGLGDDPERMEPAAAALYGSLHLRSSVLAARSGDADLSDEHLRLAGHAAQSLAGDSTNYYGLEFRPSNVALHAVSAAVELEDGAKAIERALPLYKAFPVDLPPVRAGHHWIDVARGWYYHGDRGQAFDALRRARSAAPQQVRNHPMVRELVQTMASTGARPSEDLRRFAAWLGLV